MKVPRGRFSSEILKINRILEEIKLLFSFFFIKKRVDICWVEPNSSWYQGGPRLQPIPCLDPLMLDGPEFEF